MENSKFPQVDNIKVFDDPELAVDYLTELYAAHTKIIKNAFKNFVKNQSMQSCSIPESLQGGNYPYIGLEITPQNLNTSPLDAYGVAAETGLYGGTFTQPDIFRSYYIEQLGLLMRHHNIPVYVGTSDWTIPLPFVLDPSLSKLGPDQLWQLQIEFAQPDLSIVDDNVPNCTMDFSRDRILPLSLFSGERVDFSLQRLHHYTGTLPQHFQRFVLLTNYQRYIDEFLIFAGQQLKTDSGYTALIEPGNVVTTNDTETDKKLSKPLKHLPQMPAYHLKRDDQDGVTLINIGVGPSNAKTITDHLAVLRPHCWLMLGHCAGLRRSQSLGDYVLAHGYVREDAVLDQDVPLWTPIPPIAEMQVALQEAVAVVTECRGKNLKQRMRTGTVITTANRNWELRYQEVLKRLKQSRAIAVDMESATIATNGYRFRVPYGTLLCVSDKPIHGEIKLRGMANNFYHQSISQHLEIGLKTFDILRKNGVENLHSRKLRAFDDPPFL